MQLLQTPRFTLRHFVAGDQSALSFIEDPEWGKYLSHSFPSLETFFDNCVASKCEEGLDLVIDSDGTAIGSVHLGLGAPSHVGELACLIRRENWGFGVALEVCTTLLDHAFTSTKLIKAVAHCDARNTQSWRVLNRLGMTREGVSRRNRLARDGVLVDEYCYGILKEDWMEKRGLA